MQFSHHYMPTRASLYNEIKGREMGGFLDHHSGDRDTRVNVWGL